MKKLMYIMAGLILAVAMISCEKEKMNPKGVEVGKDNAAKAQIVSITEPEPSTPALGDYTPYLIPGKNKGGNRTCEEAQAAFDIMALDDLSEFHNMSLGDFTDCGEKVDIDDDYAGEVEGFPFYVEVNDDGTIYFNTGNPDCLVKIVIVKGSNNANVYYFPEGVSTADGLSSPAFEDGRIPWVSNLTFCCFCEDVPVEEEIAVKVWYNWDDRQGWGASEGSVYPFENAWCEYLGVNEYVEGSFDLLKSGYGDIVGTVTVMEDGEVVIDMVEGLTIDQASVFIGDLDDLINLNIASDGCPDYENDEVWIVETPTTAENVITITP